MWESLQELKKYFASPPLLSKTEPKEPLFLNLAVSKHAVSAVLVREVEKVQHPVYYVSQVLQDAKMHYTDLEKLDFTLLSAARKLRPYFQSHIINVPTNYPLEQALNGLDSSGRLC